MFLVGPGVELEGPLKFNCNAMGAGLESFVRPGFMMMMMIVVVFEWISGEVGLLLECFTQPLSISITHWIDLLYSHLESDHAQF